MKMERRQFMGKAGCALAGLAATSLLTETVANAQSQKLRRYKIEIEIYEAPENSFCFKKGEKFKYPDDIRKRCPWLASSMHDFIVALKYGATFGWTYSGTKFEKVIDPDGITTEYVRCPDPTVEVVAKIIRTKVG